MTVADIQALLGLLTVALQRPFQRVESIKSFQKHVWEGLDPELPEDVRNILRELAYHLDFFEPNPRSRETDRVYYGHDRAEREIRDALAELQAAGIQLPTADESSS